MIKKLISLFISFTILLTPFGVKALSTESESMSAKEFSDNLITFLDDGWQYSSSDFIPGSGTIDLQDIKTNRLIVSTISNEILENDCGAVSKLEGFNNWHILQYSCEESADEAYDYFTNQNYVNYVEFDKIIELASTPPIIPKPETPCWSVSTVKTAEAFQFLEEKNIKHNNKVIVAVIDSGVDETHSFFKDSQEISRILPSDREMDNTYDPEWIQWYHGTMVSGVLIKNTKENVKIKSYNVFYQLKKANEFEGKNISTSSMLASEIKLAVDDGADIINLSLYGWGNAQVILDEIKHAKNDNVVVVAAAGNSGKNADGYYPSKFEECITVAAMDSSFFPWKTDNDGSTNYGDVVDISAPGDNIVTTMPDEQYAIGYATSIAAPFVSAAAAILKSIDPEMTSEEITRRIKETAYVPDNWDKKCDGKPYGTGIVNFLNMVKAEVTEVKPTISIKNGKIVITAPEGSDSRIYYSLDGTVPTIDNPLTYTEPLDIGGMNVDTITAVCHENGKLIGEPVTFNTTVRIDLNTLYFRHTTNPMPENIASEAMWKSSNPDIASVDRKGNITGVSPGTAYVYATRADGIKMVYKVTVDYSLWQEILIKLFFGFLWYI